MIKAHRTPAPKSTKVASGGATIDAVYMLEISSPDALGRSALGTTAPSTASLDGLKNWLKLAASATAA
jgi:hypothetical protein